MLCSEATLVNSNADGGQAVILRCKRWSCEICRPHNRWAVIKKAQDGKPTTFLTLTCDPARYETPDEAARDLKRALVLLRRHLLEVKGIEKLPFICVFEKHKSGWPHMHLLIRAPYIHWKWLSLHMKKMIGAQAIHIRKVSRKKGAAHYISKYIGKDPHAFQGCKRWWRSHNYDQKEEDQEPKLRYGHHWQNAEVHFQKFVETLADTGMIIVESRKGYVQWEPEYPDWEYQHRRSVSALKAEDRRLGRRSWRGRPKHA